MNTCHIVFFVNGGLWQQYNLFWANFTAEDNSQEPGAYQRSLESCGQGHSCDHPIALSLLSLLSLLSALSLSLWCAAIAIFGTWISELGSLTILDITGGEGTLM